MECSLNQQIFNDICETFGTPDVDLFASRLNHKLPKYVSWEPDLGNWKTDAFTFPWSNMFVYCFPPFRILPRVIRKLWEDDKPQWTSQPWYPLLRRLASTHEMYPSRLDNLTGQGQLRFDIDTESIRGTRLMSYLFLSAH